MIYQSNAHKREPIDAVIYWVDGNDPKLSAKRDYYLGSAQNVNVRATRPTFYASHNEIKYFVYLHPIYSKRRIDRKIKRCINDQDINSVCAQSLDMFEREERERIFAWMDDILGTR